MTAKALATESGLNFIAIKGPELFNKYVGETEKSIREIFRYKMIFNHKGKREYLLHVLYSLMKSMQWQCKGAQETKGIFSYINIRNNVSDRILCQLLNEIDGVESLSQVIIIGATNRPDCLDKVHHYINI